MDKIEISDISRRMFLYGVGVLALSACGGGGGSSSAGSSSSGGTTSYTFSHPSLLHTQEDFERMAAKVLANESPWVDSWNILITNTHASLSYTPSPQSVVYRNDPNNGADNSAKLFNDVAAAYACALRWKISGDSDYADKAVEIMDAWSAVLTKISWSDGYHDGFLAAGLQGYQFANAAEIMHSYSGWSTTNFQRFQMMMREVFHPMNGRLLSAPTSLRSYSNWDLCAIAAIIATGVVCDDSEMFEGGIEYFKNGLGNGCVYNVVNYIHDGYLGQTQESGRDQGHNTLSVMLLTTICEMAWNQGVDLYGFANNRVLAAAEYVSKGNLIDDTTSTYYTMPFSTYTNGNVTHTEFATGSQGSLRAGWALIYHHYVNRKGLAAPYTKRYMLATQPEGGGGNYGPNSGGYDQLGYTTLTASRDAITTKLPPSGLSAYVSGGNVTLSWWGSAYATSYNLYRSTSSGGNYTLIASEISDLLTYTDTSVSSGTYYYVVKAVISGVESEASNELSVVTSVELYTSLGSSEFSFNGTDEYEILSEGVMSNLGDFSIVCKVYWNGGDNWQRIFDFGSGTGRYMFLTPKSNTNTMRFAITTNSGIAEQIVNASSTLPTGEWVHVAVTLEGTTLTLYVNGVSVGSNTEVLSAPFRLGETAQNYLGRSQYESDPYFNGIIKDFDIYHGALSELEVANLA
ncbi:LamG-like jellyroll fold domain-containing protein [Sulfurimonas sp.]|uniref:LamG-like jellyroll fold domain-containing protein n=1 Tax=Sulfurimonas sp. TaxID=2022749 RepID=UPI003D1492F5